MKSFSELPLSAPLRSNLAKHGFIEPTPVQALAIEPALAGRDLVATAQTGTGKTLAFVVPILQIISDLPKQPAATGLRAIVLNYVQIQTAQAKAYATDSYQTNGINAFTSRSY